MKKCFKTLILAVAVSYSPITLWAALPHKPPHKPPHHEPYHEKNYFQFAISKYHTSRQSGQTVDIYVRYAYKPGLPSDKYPDYRILRTAILKYMEPSDELPADVYWELIATQMGKELMHDFPLDGISIQLHVLDKQDVNHAEPGDHGPIFTIGHIAPLAVH